MPESSWIVTSGNEVCGQVALGGFQIPRGGALSSIADRITDLVGRQEVCCRVRTHDVYVPFGASFGLAFVSGVVGASWGALGGAAGVCPTICTTLPPSHAKPGPVA